MFGLFFLVVIPLMFFGYVYFVNKVFAKAHTLVRVGAVSAAIFLPMGYFFLWQFSEGYKQFEQLCSSPERVKIFKIIPVASYYSKNSHDGVKLLRSTNYVSTVNDKNEYRRGPVFDSKACQENYKWPLPEGCLIEIQGNKDANYLKVDSSYGGKDIPGGFNSLLRMSFTQYHNETHGVMAEVYDYTYYKYGTGWATILGAASGSAPSISCKEWAKFDIQQITPPKP
jgi:hypothetical protein